MQSDLKIEWNQQTAHVLPSTTHKETVIWLHGLGDTPEGFSGIFGSLQYTPFSSSTRVVMPTAPVRRVTLNMGMPSTSWFDIKDFSITASNFSTAVGVDEIKESAETVNKIIAEEVKRIGSSRKVYVGGFSQGCCIALHCALSYPESLGGIICISGFLFPITQISEQNKDTPLFISHGKQDFVIQQLMSQASYERLIVQKKERKIFDFNVESNLGHEVGQVTLKKLKSFFTQSQGINN